jgi:hypothetical protein
MDEEADSLFGLQEVLWKLINRLDPEKQRFLNPVSVSINVVDYTLFLIKVPKKNPIITPLQIYFWTFLIWPMKEEIGPPHSRPERAQPQNIH